ncbi:MAG: AtpZ/AtpI family protein [Candidatus Kerfeldbacteria bacterium]|nr:AtpZ/AtpI family protein [Candidatus Kerfeldbacteria bacterium]
MIEIPKKTDGQAVGGQPKSMVWQAIGFAWDFGIIVVVPLVALGVLGRFLDKRLNTSPWLFLGGAILAIIISTILVVVRLNAIIAKTTNRKK